MPSIAPERLAEHVWRVPVPCRTLPPYDHVNSYLIAANGIGAIVDPGSDRPEALDGLLELTRQVGVRRLEAVLLTHTHSDHVAGLGAVLAAFDAPEVRVHPLEADRVRAASAPLPLDDEGVLAVGDTPVRALHTPGHSPGHLSFLIPGDGGTVALVGDLVAGEGSSWVGAPEGEVASYLRSLARLRALRPALLGPGHGPVVRDPDAKLAHSAAHRLERERQLVAALADGVGALTQLRERLYPGLPEAAHGLAERSLLAHLFKLIAEGKVARRGDDPAGPYELLR